MYMYEDLQMITVIELNLNHVVQFTCCESCSYIL